MIIDKLENSKLYNSLNANFAEVFEYLKTLKAENGEVSFVLKEGDVWGSVSVKESLSSEGRMFEAHKKFIDIHFILQGAETYSHAYTDELTPATEYNEAEDYYFLEGKGGNSVTLKAGEFCIVYPQDAHIPMHTKVSTENLVRGVVKIRI